jgi:hypothetical protein
MLRQPHEKFNIYILIDTLLAHLHNKVQVTYIYVFYQMIYDTTDKVVI